MTMTLYGIRNCDTVRKARALADADKADLDESKAIALMIANPSLIKRPVLTGAMEAPLVGFRAAAYEAALPLKGVLRGVPRNTTRDLKALSAATQGRFRPPRVQNNARSTVQADRASSLPSARIPTDQTPRPARTPTVPHQARPSPPCSA
jgi:hypothetical protein